MTQGRREVAGFLAAWQLTEIASWFGVQLDPAGINPFRPADPPSEKMLALLEWRRKRAMRRFGSDAAAGATKG